MLIKDLVVGAWYKSPKTSCPLRYKKHEVAFGDIMNFLFESEYGLTYVFPAVVPEWAEDVSEIGVEPLSSLEMELM